MGGHSYEELRAVVLDVISGRNKYLYEPNQYEHLRLAVAESFARREGRARPGVMGATYHLDPADNDLLLELFWDLFRQGIISLGINDNNRQFPFFRLTRLGTQLTLNEEAYFFHDVSSYENAIRAEVPAIDATTLLYLKESMQAFQSGCLLSATVMLGVAVEHSFQLLLDQLESHPLQATNFASACTERTLMKRFNAFSRQLEQQMKSLPPYIKEDLSTHLSGVLSTIRTYRNEAGHPTGKVLGREQVYVLLQLFITYSKKLQQLRDFFR